MKTRNLIMKHYLTFSKLLDESIDPRLIQLSLLIKDALIEIDISLSKELQDGARRK